MEKLIIPNIQIFLDKLSNYISEIVSQYKSHRTEIEVLELGYLFVIYGKTENKEKIDMKKIILDFFNICDEEFRNYNTLSTLDLIEYKYEFSDYPKNLKFRFDLIDEVPSQSNSSKFPNGYVKNKLVDVYNLLSLINEKSKYNFRNNWSTFEFELNDDMLEIINYESDSYYNNSKLISILKDNLDGNIYENKEINLMVI